MTFEEILPGVEVGQTFGPFDLVINSDLNEQYLFALRDFDNRYTESDGEATPLVHPGVLLNASMTVMMKFKPGQGWTGFHGRDEIEWFEPAKVDEKMQVTYEVVELLEKRGRPWWIREARITNASGELKLRRRIHTAFLKNVQ